MITQARAEKSDPGSRVFETHRNNPQTPKDMLRKIFIGNLPKNSDESSLELFLADFGLVFEVRIAYSPSTKIC